jgi:hypothetical protein
MGLVSRRVNKTAPAMIPDASGRRGGVRPEKRAPYLLAIQSRDIW